MANIQDIELAFEYVSSSPPFTCRAIYDKKADCFYFESELIGESDVPEDLDWDHCVEIPHKNDLNLGKVLVFEFVEQRLPDEYDRVTSFFRKAGAYARFKDMLEYKGALQEWYDFENSARQQALKEWCRDNGIEI